MELDTSNICIIIHFWWIDKMEILDNGPDGIFRQIDKMEFLDYTLKRNAPFAIIVSGV
jgi:hypothetical protein